MMKKTLPWLALLYWHRMDRVHFYILHSCEICINDLARDNGDLMPTICFRNDEDEFLVLLSKSACR